MRILIGNHIDPSIRERTDMRAWTQRVLWFAHPGDLILLCCQPDAGFLEYALVHTGVPRAELTIIVAPAGTWGNKVLDPMSLENPDLIAEVRATLGPSGTATVDEIFALWPSASVARFADAIGISAQFPGAAFFAQGGGELGNNKANFRALAAAAGVRIPVGRVCRSQVEAVAATNALLERSGDRAVMVKQAHNGAGVGNQLLVRDPRLLVDHVGARHLHHLAPGTSGVEAYWRERWSWASTNGRWPVVIEEFAVNASAVYSEHYASDDGTHPTETGHLIYVARRLSHQVVPLSPDVPEQTRTALLDGGARLAEAYRAFGYRGYLSADALVLPDGQVVFTEVNAQVSGSLHIYQTIAHQIVDVNAEPRRSVVEYHVPPTWVVPSFDTFLTALDDLDLRYDDVTRSGVIVSMPAIPLTPGAPVQFVFCIAYDPAVGYEESFGRLDERFAAIPADAIDPSQHVGTTVLNFSS
ncbi:hypothetical protein [Kineosporia sp. NBRC 101731]|uniref:preATP grasp domain-containing protein n=1 Tax=Kineosporia sp. NBRC 101731 TaxID=3032199 RepID=UPI0024A18C36|nr:hypothetical protein [Kineosporia sp. NBRC 101731]GLY30447.1 hypothetical protein Kisp02_38120 [Kineosporia sp. NBRC 101731]